MHMVTSVCYSKRLAQFGPTHRFGNGVLSEARRLTMDNNDFFFHKVDFRVNKNV